ncbi:hypothetical protein [Streptomyces sulphureus]|uniref:hypothetical protein n=1 Tax=Streptomyces sulphureus TaxID=47758 RepID=UPI000368C24E|nr:hypothetical protein [Streptomyces sulphureus]
MAVDPTDPDFEDIYEDESEEEMDIEAPEADAAEQAAELLRQRQEPITERGVTEADPADAAEQAEVVEETDEEEYR